jgi:hypothetical protein
MKIFTLFSILVLYSAIFRDAPPSNAADPSAAGVAVEKNDRDVKASYNGRPVLEYRYQASPMKPYVRELFTPEGVQILRDQVPDHKHHHGLMFAVKVEGVDFWSETEGCGTEQNQSLQAEASEFRPEGSEGIAGQGHVVLPQHLQWIDPQNHKPLMEEERQITVHFAPDLHATLLTWQSRLSPAAGRQSVKLEGDHYFGLGMRFVESMDKAGEFLNSEKAEGEVVRGSERLTPARWCAYTSAVEGKPVTVAIFDHPDNPRHPNKFFTMRPFAYLAATLNLWKEPLTIETGHPLDLVYGVGLWDGKVGPEEVEKLYRHWQKLKSAESKQ